MEPKRDINKIIDNIKMLNNAFEIYKKRLNGKHCDLMIMTREQFNMLQQELNGSKFISIEPELEKSIVNFCDDELNYHINESGCAEEYENEINAQIKLLEKLGYNQMAETYKEQFDYMKGEKNETDN